VAESNKILTVSYGTFSCTLEGFDDAFGTMKAIAEYFRDLAAEDRFFGAEPPTPDPELLAHLASQASARRVAAHQSDTGIVLRQDDSLAVENSGPVTASGLAAAGLAAPVAEPVAKPVDEPVSETVTSEPADMADLTEDTLADIVQEVNRETEDDLAADADPVDLDLADAVLDQPGLAADQPPLGDDDVLAAAMDNAGLDAADLDDTAPMSDPILDASQDDTDDTADLIARDVVAETPRRLTNRVTVTTTRPEAARISAQVSAPVRRDVQDAPVARAADTADDIDGADTIATRGNRVITVSRAATAAPAHPDANSVAAKLQRIRDVVAKDRKPVEMPDFSEDEHAEDFDADLTDDQETGFEEDLTADLSADHGADPEDLDGDFDGADSLFADTQDELSEEDASEVDGDNDDLTAELDEINATIEAVSADLDDDLDDDDAGEIDAAPAAEANGAPVPRNWARVVKVKRADFDEAVENGALEADDDFDVDYEDDEDDAAEAAIADSQLTDTLGDSTLSPEDEAELQNELAALEAEINEDVAGDADFDEDEDDQDADLTQSDDWGEDSDMSYADVDTDEDDDLDDLDDFDDEVEAQTATQIAPADQDQPAPLRRRRLLDQGAEDNMDRILAETNHQLGDSDGSRRRSAIQHLRAAVAATQAEKEAGSDFAEDTAEGAEAYREDLAQVVRPRRPTTSGGSARRSEDRPAPLKLVAEQRVDLGSAPRGPVTPRRVRVADISRDDEAAPKVTLRRQDMDHDAEGHSRAAAANAKSFAEFADRVGAIDLPDVLEAAASYLAFVEGRDQFSRPQLMTKVRQLEIDGFTREDGLRHFGQLLREGKIRKIAGGRFAVSDRINFRPEDRVAG
jgi:hypothetical protein